MQLLATRSGETASSELQRVRSELEAKVNEELRKELMDLRLELEQKMNACEREHAEECERLRQEVRRAHEDSEAQAAASAGRRPHARVVQTRSKVGLGLRYHH